MCNVLCISWTRLSKWVIFNLLVTLFYNILSSVCVPSKTLHFIYSLVFFAVVALPTCASEQDKVIGVGVHIYVYIDLDKKKIEAYFSDRPTFSNIHGRTSRLNIISVTMS